MPKQPANAELREADGNRPLSSLLSQVLVAHTIEVDGEFERRMLQGGRRGGRLSLVVWLNTIRFIPEGGLTVRELATLGLKGQERVRAELGCLERWGFISVSSGSADDAASAPAPASRGRRGSRPGWGSGRGLRSDSIIQLTADGRLASQIWPTLIEEIESRWQARIGKRALSQIRSALQSIVDSAALELPQGFPDGLQPLGPFPPRRSPIAGPLPLAALLSQALQLFTIDFDDESPVPLALCANAIRVLGTDPVSLSEIPRLTGGSPEMAGIGWQLKPYVVVETDPSRGRGKLVRLSERGIKARQAYLRLTKRIETRWQDRFGIDLIRQLRESLLALFESRSDDPSPILASLEPPPETARFGVFAPSLGRREVGAAARQRGRDLLAQTAAFIQDPASALPHHPLWDMNRGFGP